MPLFLESDGTGAWESARFTWRREDDGVRIDIAEGQYNFRGRTPTFTAVLDGTDTLVLSGDGGETRFTRVPGEQVFSRGFLSGSGQTVSGTITFDRDGSVYGDDGLRGQYSVSDLGYILLVPEGSSNEIPFGYAETVEGAIRVQPFVNRGNIGDREFILE